MAVGVVEVMQSKADLLEIVRAFHATGSFTYFLNRRQQEANQYGNDRNHHQ